MQWPPWWQLQLELTPHVEKRMEDRGFNEVDLRAMLEAASGYRDDVVDGRYVIETRHRRADWEVIVEPTKWRILWLSSPPTQSAL